MFNVEEDAKVVPGYVDFKITHVVDSDDYGQPLLSKENKIPMIKLGVSLKDDFGNSEFLWVYLMGNKRYMFKNLFYAINKPNLYVSKGPLVFDPTNDLLGCTGKCRVDLSPGNERFPEPRTEIKAWVDATIPQDLPKSDPTSAFMKPEAAQAYLAQQAQQEQEQAAAQVAQLDDSIPF